MKRWIPYILYAGIIFSLFLPAFFGGAQSLLFGDDIHHHYYFYRQFFNTWLSHGVFPWWNPYVFSGAPFVGNPIVNIWYPINWVYSIIPLPYAYMFHLWFHLTLGASSMYLLVKCLVREKQIFSLSGFTSGLVFVFCGFMSARILAGHVDVIAAASYMPLVVYFFFQVMEKGRKKDIVRAGMAFGLQLLSGYHTMGFFTLLVIGMIVVYIAIQKRSLRHSIPVVIAVMLGFGISAVSLLPIQEFVRLSLRTIPRPYSWASYGSLPIDAFARQLMNPFAFGKPFEYTGPPPNFFEHAFFFGRTSLVVMMLGCVSVFFQKKYRRVFFLFGMILLFGAWMSFGNFAPVDLQHFMWQIVPFYRMLRIPPRHLVLVVFSASVLVGLGMSSIRKKVVQSMVLCLIFAELFVYAESFVQTKPLPKQTHDANLISLLKDDPNLFRTLPNFGCWLEPRSSLDFNEVMAEGIYSVTGYDPTIFRPYYEFIDAVNGSTASSILEHDVQVPYLDLSSSAVSFLNIKYLFVPSYIDPINSVSNTEYQLVKEDEKRQYRLYEKQSFLPRFFFVPTITVFDTYKNLTAAIREKRFDFIKTAGVEKKDIQGMSFDADCKEGETGSVEVVSYTPNRIKLHTNSPCNAFLSSSEVMYPGWEATIDGRKTTIMTGNMVFRSLYVTKGEHEIEFVFVPRIVLFGAIITTISLAFGFFLFKNKS